MVVSFNCTCGNKDKSKVKEYDGALGYEALVCKVCGTYYDFDPNGKPRTNPPDKWSKELVGIKDKVETVKNPIDLIDKYDRFQTDGDGDMKLGN
jgi:hypothetical protein